MSCLPIIALVLACVSALPAAVTLPVEVFGPDGTVVAVPVTVPAGSSPTSLWLRVHGLGYAGKAAVQINAGAWTVLANDTPGLEIAEPGKRYGGIGGSFSSIVLTLALPAGAMPAGANTIRFRFERTDGRSMGWRVLALDALDADGRRLLDQDQFREDDPATWTAPRPAAADIAEGERLWRHAELRTSPLTTRTISARCSDCHAQDGRDLKYFNFTNHSIIERAKFHGLSPTQGEQIASYIRTLPVPNPGRPWNPPYQPGPGLSQKPVSEWSAGAGLEWALADDTASQAYIPGNATDASVFKDGPYLKDLERHDIPIALQLLDWNHWLPLVHPKDAYGTAFTEHGAYTRYLDIRAGLEGKRGMTREEYIVGPMLDEFANWGGHSFGGEQGPDVPRDPWTAERAEHYYAGAVWGAAKQWEIMQEFGLETLSRRFFGANGRPRSWFSNRHVFNVSTHILGIPAEFSVGGVDATSTSHNYFANVWYELQLQLNAGQRQRRVGGFHTIDWGYMAGLINDMDRFGTRHGEPMRATLFALTSFVEHDTGIGPEGYDGDGNPWWGWNLRDSVPWAANFRSDGFWDEHPTPRPVLQMLYQLWLEKSATFPAESWMLQRGKQYAGANVPPADYVIGTDGGEAFDRNIAESLHTDLVRLRDRLAVHPAVLTGICHFGEMMWPASDWAAFVPVDPAAPAKPMTPTATSGVRRITLGWNAVGGATSYNVQRATAGDAWMTVAFFVTGTTWTDRGLDPAISYRYRVSANTATAVGAPSAPSVSIAPHRGLIAHWTFDERAGARAVDTVDGNDGQLIESPTWQAGVRGGALRFDGQLRYVGVPRTLHRTLAGSATVAAWISTAAVGTSSYRDAPALLGHSDGVRWGVLDDAGRIAVALDDGRAVSAVAVNDGAWHHVAFTRDALRGELAVYVDGVRSGSGLGGEGEFRDRIHALGMLEDERTPWNGALDEVRIYDRVLSAGEILALADASAEPPMGLAPIILTQPTAQAVSAGQAATFTVLADGTGPLAYQWWRQGGPIPGATGTSYTTGPAAAADHGARFTVVVSNAVGSVTSATVELAVIGGTDAGSGGVAGATGAATGGSSRGCGLGSGFTVLVAAAVAGLARRRRSSAG